MELSIGKKRQIIQVIQIEKPKVALTFDDGPNKKYTPALLNELGKRGIHASFFLMGKNIPGNEKLVATDAKGRTSVGKPYL